MHRVPLSCRLNTHTYTHQVACPVKTSDPAEHTHTHTNTHTRTHTNLDSLELHAQRLLLSRHFQCHGALLSRLSVGTGYLLLQLFLLVLCMGVNGIDTSACCSVFLCNVRQARVNLLCCYTVQCHSLRLSLLLCLSMQFPSFKTQLASLLCRVCESLQLHENLHTE